MSLKSNNNTTTPSIPIVNSFKSIKTIIQKDGNPVSNSDIRLIKWDGSIPNVLFGKKTDSKGELLFDNFDANSKYEIRMANGAYKFDNDFITLETDKNKNIVKINDKTLDSKFNGNIIFNAAEKKDNAFKLYDLNIKVQYEDGKSAEGVEITANTLTPKLASYKNLTSDKNGMVNFKLESQEGGKLYSICVSKNGQFLWSFKPETIDVIVSPDGKISTIKNTPLVITVKKEDKTYLKKIIKEKIALAEKLLSSPDCKKESKLELEKALKGAEDEMSKPETIPPYVQGAIDNIENGIKKLVKSVNVNIPNKKPIFNGVSSSTPSKKTNSENSINNENVKSHSIKFNRISGNDRIETSIAVSRKEYKSADTVIIANGYNYVDALTASPLASVHKAPILLTKKNTINDSTIKEIKRLGAKNIIIIGGENSISSDVFSSIPKEINITRIAGEDRFETSWLIAKEVMKMNESNNVVIASGYNLADSLSASSLVQKYNSPIILYDNACKCGVNNQDELKSLLKKNFIVVGGENSVTKKAESDFNVVKRYAGKDRYDTSKLIANDVFTKGSNLYLASGKEFADALSISPVLTKNMSTLLLINNTNASNMIKGFEYKNLTVVGGTNTISDLK